MRRDPKVHEHADDLSGRHEVRVGGDNIAEIPECGVDDARPVPERAQTPRRGTAGVGIAVDSQETQLGRHVQDCGGVTAAAQCGVDDHSGGQAGEQLDDFMFEYWYVVVVLGHLQPFNRQDRREGGGGFPSCLDDCQAARGPRQVQLLGSFH